MSENKEKTNKLFDTCFSLEDKIHAYFGYKPEVRILPIVDIRHMNWALNQNAAGYGWVWRSEKPLTLDLIEKGSEVYSDKIYTQRDLPYWVYRAEDFTMVCSDPETSSGEYLAIYDNAKEVHFAPGEIDAASEKMSARIAAQVRTPRTKYS